MTLMQTSNITDRAMLVNLSIKQWTANRHDKRASAEVAHNHNSSVEMGRYQKQLLSKGALLAIKQAANSARTDHYELTLPWSDSGARILSSTGFMRYSERMRKHDSAFWTAVDTFVNEYPDLVNEARRMLNGLFNPAEYPSVRSIRDFFAFGFNVLPMPSADDFRVNLGTAETARIRSEIESQVNASIAGAMSDVWTRMRDVVSHMASKLRAYNVDANDGVSNPFRDSLVQNIRDLVEILPALNLTDDPDVDAFTQRMRNELCHHSPDTLRASSFAREETAAAAERILSQMEAFI